MSNSGVIGTWKGYPFQEFEVNEGDLLLFHVSDDLDLCSCQEVFEMLKKEFPQNTVMISNEHIVKGLTIFRKAKQQDKVVSICDDINLNDIFDEIMKGNPNDFLY